MNGRKGQIAVSEELAKAAELSLKQIRNLGGVKRLNAMPRDAARLLIGIAIRYRYRNQVHRQ